MMDESAKFWKSTDQGCNYCDSYLERRLSASGNNGSFHSIEDILDRNAPGSGDFDCMFLLSGGIDSTYALHKLSKFGVKPLVVNMNNSWDSNLAQHNINQVIEAMKFDLHTEVLDWPVYREWQLLLIKADFLDLEILYDQALAGIASRVAKKYNIKLIITGSNHATEGMVMPINWALPEKRDPRILFDIDKRIGSGKLKDLDFPFHSFFDSSIDKHVRKIKYVPILNHSSYDKKEALATLSKEYGFLRYPGKHHESIFTRFYQSFILWEKGQIDKRKHHLSCLLLDNQITREEALDELHKRPSDYLERDSDQEFILKKLKMSHREFKEYLLRPFIHYSKFRNLQRRAEWKVRKSLKN